MKIELEIPDWANWKTLYIVSGMELVAYKESGNNKWNIKKERCNQCGACCSINPQHGSYFPLNEDGSCSKLIKDGHKKVCCIGMEKPFACVIGEPIGREHEIFKCSIQYLKE